MLTEKTWTPEHTKRAQEIWARYQQEHDVTGLKGQTAGIDPLSGRVWIGDSMLDVVGQLDAEGIRIPLYFVRVGFDYYWRKGGHQGSRVAGAAALNSRR
jgi:hypothetical protein